MSTIIEGKVFEVGDDINTDYVIPAKYLDLYEPEDLAPHAFEGLGEEYPAKLRGHSVIVAGENFGLGSAREQAPNALKGAGVKAILAKSFARIFYRNTLNVGIAPIECKEAAEKVKGGDTIAIDLEAGTIVSGKKTYHFPMFPDVVMQILSAGGMIPYLKKELNIRHK